MGRQQSHIWLGVGAFFLVLLGTVLIWSPVSYAAMGSSVLYSPNYPSYERLNVTSSASTSTAPLDGPPTKLDHIAHVLKYEGSSDILRIELGAYSEVSMAGATFEIARESVNTTCRVQTDSDTDGDNDPFITVIVSYGGAKNVYNIQYRNVCDAGTKLNPNDTSKKVRYNGNQFFATYTIPTPNPLPAVDMSTQLYKATITIKYGSESNTLVPKASGSNDQNVRFLVKLNAPCNPTVCHSYLEPLAQGSSVRNYSTLYEDNSAGDFFSMQRFEFGLPCTETSGRNLLVKVYDLDTGQDTNWNPVPGGLSGGRGGMYVEKLDPATGTWSRLAKAAYKSIVNGTTTTNLTYMGGDAVKQDTGSGKTTSFIILADPHTRYRLVLTPIKSKNLVGVGLPTDSIYGAIECRTTGTQPYFSVYGGDIMAGIMMGGVQNNNAIIGSWFDEDANQGSSTELAALASGDIGGFATNITDAAAMATGVKTLAFDNTDDPPGHFRAFPTGNNDYVGSAVSASQADGSWHQGNVADLWDLAGKKGTYQYGTAAAPVTAVVNAANRVAAGTTVTLVVYGNVYIGSNLNYNPYSFASVPRLNIYATGNIIVDKNVGNLQGVFIAQGGAFYTCGNPVTRQGYEYTALLNSGCGNPLSIYGAVAAQTVVLGRFSGDIKGAAAESLYMSPELWLAQPSTPSSSFDSYLSLPPVL